MAEVDLAAGVGVEEVNVIARAGERGDVREVDLAGRSGAVRPAGAAGLDRQVGATEGRQRGQTRKRDHGTVAGEDLTASDRGDLRRGDRRQAVDVQVGAAERGQERIEQGAAGGNVDFGVAGLVGDRCWARMRGRARCRCR